MRDYGVVSPKFWIGSTGKSLRGDADAQILALYLMTGPHAVSTGVYHCPKLYMAHETGLSIEGASKALQRLIEAHFCEYDEASEWVFVCQMALFQIGELVAVKDKRHKWLLREIENMPNPLREKFIAIYGGAYEIPNWEPQQRPIEAPSKPHRSQDHDHGQEQDQEHGQDARPIFDGWKFVEDRMQPNFPEGDYPQTAWISASRTVERIVETDGLAVLDAIEAGCKRFLAQATARGEAGGPFIVNPDRFLTERRWTGKFAIPPPKGRIGSAADRVTWRPDA